MGPLCGPCLTLAEAYLASGRGTVNGVPIEGFRPMSAEDEALLAAAWVLGS